MSKQTITSNLIVEKWANLDSYELRLILDKYITGPGQYSGRANNPNKLFLPLAGPSCRIMLTFRNKKIIAIESGPAFNAAEWEHISKEIDNLLLEHVKIGREFSFSSFRVLGSWHGDRSGVQILPPPTDAPSAPVEMADHPFIFEFPIKVSEYWPITNHRRLREHRKLTHLLNILLAGRTSLQTRRYEHFWAVVSSDVDHPEIQWVQQLFFAKLGEVVIDGLSTATDERLEAVEPEEYYTKVGHDGKGLRVPTDLDESICLYLQLSPTNRVKFDRATFWMDMASRQWNISVSASFAALVSAIESLTERGKTHRVYCDDCKDHFQHEVPGQQKDLDRFSKSIHLALLIEAVELRCTPSDLVSFMEVN